MDNAALEDYLKNTLSDLALSQSERSQLRELGQTLTLEQSSFMRNRAFDLVRNQLARAPQDLQPTLRWLELVIKTLDISSIQPKVNSMAYFSPGETCRDKIRTMLNQAHSQVDICVFTIADDILTDAIVNAHKRNVQIRIITDDDKSEDNGSDIKYLQKQGVTILTDNSPYHMHHKFAIFDNSCLLNGSFNWTRSASQQNQENLSVTDDMNLILAYQKEFNKLWTQFS